MKYDITFHPSWWYKNANIHFNQDFFDEPEYRIESDVKMRRILYEYFGDYGIGEKEPQKRPLLGTNLLAAGYLLSELMGCKIQYQEDNSPQVECLNLDEDSIAHVKVPDLDKSQVWGRTQRQIDYMLKKYGHVKPYINLMGIQNIAMDLMGQELMVSYYTAPEEVMDLLEKITHLSIAVGKRLKALSSDISGGVTSIISQTMPKVYLTSNCSVEMISNKLYEEFLLPWDQKLASSFEHFGVHHCGSTMEHVVDGYGKIDGLEFAEVGAFSQVKAVRKRLPGVFLNTRYSPVHLMEAEEEEVLGDVRSLVKDGQENGGLISVSCVGIDKNIPDEQIKYFLKACKKVQEEMLLER